MATIGSSNDSMQSPPGTRLAVALSELKPLNDKVALDVARTNARQQDVRQATEQLNPSNNNTQDQRPTPADNEAVRVSTTIGRFASAGGLSKEEALQIYRAIAHLL